jgi:hypothetical protein
MGSRPFSAPHMYWVGMNLPRASRSDLEEFNHFYEVIHAPEVLHHNPGFVHLHRYEILEADPRGDLGPTFLAIYEATDEAAERHIEREDGPPGDKPRYSSGPRVWEERALVWRMIWSRIPGTVIGSDPPSVEPKSIFIVGMEPGEGGEAELQEFNTFYTGTHVGEVVATGGYDRGSRYELRRAFLHPGGRCPRYCAIYEGDEEVTEAVSNGVLHPTIPDPTRNLSAGPEVWGRRTTMWRHVFRSRGTNNLG